MCHISTVEHHTTRSISQRRPRRAAALAAVLLGVLALAATRRAYADTATGDQNSDYTVSTSLVSSGKDPDNASAGDTVKLVFSVTNNTLSFQQVTLGLSLESATGHKVNGHVRIPMVPRQTLAPSFDFKVPADLAKGTYRLTTRAGDPGATSHATATITII